jgi:hypothetical protein
MNIITLVASWRCQCGAHIKVLAETDRDKPIVATRSAACPECGNQQTVYGERIISIEVAPDAEWGAPRRNHSPQSHDSPS